jgi:hypothetical protein
MWRPYLASMSDLTLTKWFSAALFAGAAATQLPLLEETPCVGDRNRNVQRI